MGNIDEPLGTFINSQFNPELTEVFAENENCDLCGLALEKHARDYNLEAYLRID